MSKETAVVVRPVEPGDAAELRENVFSRNTMAEVEERIAENVRAFQESTQVLLVVEVGGVVVGTGTLVRKTHPLYAHRGEVVGLVVHPDYRRRGIARRIVEVICDRAASWKLEILEVGCRGGTPAEQVYQRLGFVECGRLPRGIQEPWGDHRVFDEVSFYMPLRSEGGVSSDP